MKEFEYLDPKEKITAFVDGELDPTESSDLFYRLASDPELQEELQKQMLLKGLFKNGQTAPPQYLKSRIMKEAGLSTARGYNKFAWLSAIAFFIRNKWVLGTILGLATAGTMFFALNQKNIQISNYNNSVKTVSSSVPIISSSESDGSVFATDKVNILPTKRIISRDANKTSYNNVDKSEQRTSIAGIGHDEIEMASSESPKNNITAINPAELNGKLSLSDLNNRNVKDFRSMSLNDKIHLLKDFSIEFRLFNAQSYPNFNIKSFSSPLVNNFAIALLYSVSSNNVIGIEFGQEDFLQEYNGLLDGRDVKFRQNYNTGWGGIMYQHALNSNIGVNGLEPYMKLLVGGTKVGPIGKVTIGARYYLNEHVAVSMGLEPSILFYVYQNSIFTTRKLGITYGLQMKL